MGFRLLGLGVEVYCRLMVECFGFRDYELVRFRFYRTTYELVGLWFDSNRLSQPRSNRARISQTGHFNMDTLSKLDGR